MLCDFTKYLSDHHINTISSLDILKSPLMCHDVHRVIKADKQGYQLKNYDLTTD